MKILVTGAFGNIGKAVIEEANRRGHEIIVFDIENKKTRKDARRYRKKVRSVFFGDIRNFEDVKKAVQECDTVIHLAAIIPPISKRQRELTMDVNYGGTVNLNNAIKETKRMIPLVFTSSASVMGPSQLQNRLVDRNDPLVVTGNYEESKIKSEEFLKKNAENYLVFRLAGVLPNFSILSLASAIPLMEEIFDMHPDMRLEMIADEDAATGLVTGAEKLKLGITQKNQAYILGGGEKNGWQLRGGEFLSRLFGALSLPMPDRKYFTQDINTYHLDWYDTKEAQQEFSFQNYSAEDYFKNIKKKYAIFKLLILLFRKIIMTKLVKMSPYYSKIHENSTEE
ncbi:TPA: NAD(P)-dependent oxidoreductase [Candidatus Bathyarchaeota archaeon]|nr:NAD(P)-dependent oxidoreductase [Candidatus Bathyarchaeota archaeon]